MSSPTKSITDGNRESWLPTLQLATQEVFELMVGSALKSLDHFLTEDDWIQRALWV